MITGVVSVRQALVRATVRGPGGREGEVDFILDTGFAGFLALPASVVAALALPYLSPLLAQLADGSRVSLAVHEAVLLWEGEDRVVEVLATAGEALLGMSLLDGCDLHLDVADGGLVTIECL